LGYLWFNLRLYFLKSVSWSRQFPFVEKMVVPPWPPGHGNVESPFGILADVPLTWLALAVPLAWRGRSKEDGSNLRWFVTAAALLFGVSALTMGLFYFTCVRYEVEFLPSLLLLAAVGILGLERALADQPGRRRVARGVWGLLLGFSVAFNLLACVEYHAAAHTILGVELFQAGKVSEAIDQYEQALRLKADFVKAHLNLGVALEKTGRVQEAIKQYEQVLRLNSDYAKAHRNLGIALEQTVRVQEVIDQYEQALHLKPDDAEVQNNLGATLAQAGRVQEAIGHFEEAVRIKTDYAEAHSNLGLALAQTGKTGEAIAHYEQALRIKPDYAEAHYNLGIALEQTGNVPEAIQHYEQALRIKPDYAMAQNRLARLQDVR
jgi:tetratricopeptide (TPR) repeat protein